MKITCHDTDLTDAQWAYLQPMFPRAANGGRPPRDRRRILNAIVYLVKYDCPWRYLPADFPRWKAVYHVVCQWMAAHTWAVLHDPNSAIRPTGGRDCNRDAMAGFAAAHG